MSSPILARPVVITKPFNHAQTLIENLTRSGRQVTHFPLFEIHPLDGNDELDACLTDLSQWEMVIFVSPNAIDAFFARLAVVGEKWHASVAIGVMGDASREVVCREIRAHGLSESNVRIISPQDPIRTDSETFLAELNLSPFCPQKILIVRGDSGRDFLAERLKEQRVEVKQVSAYRRLIPEFDEKKKQVLRTLLIKQCDWVITSSAVLKTLIDWSTQLDLENAVVKLQHQLLYVPHFRIGERAKELGFQSVTLCASGDENLLLALQSQL